MEFVAEELNLEVLGASYQPYFALHTLTNSLTDTQLQIQLFREQVHIEVLKASDPFYLSYTKPASVARVYTFTEEMM